MRLCKNFLSVILSVTILISLTTANAATVYEISTVPLERNGYNLHLEKLKLVTGTPNKNILLIHGLTYSSHVFNVDVDDYSLAKFLARKGYVVWSLDLTGYGRSDALADGFMINSDYAVEDINAAADCIGAGKIDLLGWSFGTVTTSKFAAKYPDKVRRLILYAPIFNGLGDRNIIEPFNKNTWEHAASDFQKLTNGEINFDVIDSAAVNAFIANCWRYDGDSSPNGCRREIFSPKSDRLIPVDSLQCPVLVIEGTRDEYINRAILAEAVTKLPPNSDFIEISGGSHVLMIEKPFYKKFRDAVIRFLEK